MLVPTGTFSMMAVIVFVALLKGCVESTGWSSACR